MFPSYTSLLLMWGCLAGEEVPLSRERGVARGRLGARPWAAEQGCGGRGAGQQRWRANSSWVG